MKFYLVTYSIYITYSFVYYNYQSEFSIQTLIVLKLRFTVGHSILFPHPDPQWKSLGKIVPQEKKMKGANTVTPSEMTFEEPLRKSHP